MFKKQSNKKTIYVLISIALLIALIVLIFSIKVYSFYKKKQLEIENRENCSIVMIDFSNLEQKLKEQTVKKLLCTYTTNTGEAYQIIADLSIPSLNIEYPILSSTSDSLLKISLTRYWGSNPNEVGNMVVLGHNYQTDKFFSKLPNIQIGEIIKITDLSGKTLEYEVYKTDIIDPYDNSCTSQKTNGNTEITLITCYNNDESRFIAKARAI